MPSYCPILICFIISHSLFWFGIYWYQLNDQQVGSAVANERLILNSKPCNTQPMPTTTETTTTTTSTVSEPTTFITSTTARSTPPTTTTTTTASTKPAIISTASQKDVDSYMQYIQGQDHQRYSLNTMSATNADLYYSYIPQISCPTKVRVGGLVDGAKWMCNPWRLYPGNCIVYSLGVGLNTLFDEEIAQKYSCKIFAYDPDTLSGNKLLKKNIPGMNYEQLYVSGNGPKKFLKQRTLRQIVTFNHHTKIDVLKIDVEGAEFEIFDAFFDEYYIEDSPKICQILIEVHTWNVMDWIRLFRKLEQVGFLLFSREINLLGFGSKFDKLAAEYSYIHKNCLKEYGIDNFVSFKNFPPSGFFSTTLPAAPM